MMFTENLLRHVPLATQIKKVLNKHPGQRAPRMRFEQELEDFLSNTAAKETLDAVINRGRYGEIFSYNDKAELFRPTWNRDPVGLRYFAAGNRAGFSSSRERRSGLPLTAVTFPPQACNVGSVLRNIMRVFPDNKSDHHD